MVAIRNGALRATREGRGYRVNQSDASRWVTRRCPTGNGRTSWISIETAMRWYDFTPKEIVALILGDRVRAREENGRFFVMRQQVAELRQDIGYTEAQAAAKVGVTVATLRELLAGVHWRKRGLIPLVTVQAVIKRRHSQHGYTIPEAAAEVAKPASWVQERIQDGTIRVARARWDRRRPYVTAPMLARLKRAAEHDVDRKPCLSAAWINLATAARLAGVSTGTVHAWRVAGDVRTRQTRTGARFARTAVMARARRYWRTCRLHRAVPPEWLRAEQAAKEPRA
jgi:hypothetical protein